MLGPQTLLDQLQSPGPTNPRTSATRPSPICPPPKQRPSTVTNQSVAAVVTPITMSPRR